MSTRSIIERLNNPLLTWAPQFGSCVVLIGPSEHLAPCGLSTHCRLDGEPTCFGHIVHLTDLKARAA